MELVAYCTSQFCSKDLKNFSSKGVLKEDIKKGCGVCPDCGHTLLWLKKSSVRRPSTYSLRKSLTKDHKRSFFGE